MSTGEFATDAVRNSPLLAAVAAARRLGADVRAAEVLREGSNLVARLTLGSGEAVVARVATGTAVARPGGEGIARELAVAGALARAGAAVVAPSTLLPPGPHREEGFALGFWTPVEPAPDRPLDAYAAGRRLRECHEALAEWGAAPDRRAAGDAVTADASGAGGAADGERAEGDAAVLHPWGALDEAEALLARLDLHPADAELLSERGAHIRQRIDALDLPLQPVHGDAHLRNVLDDPARGPLWNDWEDAFLGPRGWDLACLYAALPPFGDHDPAAAGQAYRGYGEPLHADVLRALVAARRWQILVWGAALGRERPRSAAWFATRIGHLRRSAASEDD